MIRRASRRSSVGSEFCLVTGATGFVGAAVARALVASGHRVRVLVRPTSDRRNIDGLAIEPVIGSLENHESLTAALAGITALFHVAADYRLWVRDAAAMMAANVDGTRAIMEVALAAGVRRIVYTSSVATLGLPQTGGEADETSPVSFADMIGPYKQSKYRAEGVVRMLVAERGLPAVIVNPSTPVGPRDVKPTPTGRIIVEAASGRMPGYVDTGLNLVHVDDVASGHLLAFERGRVGERYILGGDNMSLAAMLRIIAEITGRKPPWLEVPRTAIWPIALAAEAIAMVTGREPFATRDGLRMAKKKMYFSSAKATAELGYRSRPAREGLQDAIDWFRQAGYCK
jgi:dihydroflavonol-4-reductase